jgi:hypothetical protein
MNPEDSFIGRYVAFLILPFATALSTLVAVKAKAWFGVDVDQAEALAFILSVAGGIAVWLYNNGRHEVAKITGLDEDTVDGIVKKVIEQRLPQPPSPGGTQVAGGGTISQGPGGTSSGQ